MQSMVARIWQLAVVQGWGMGDHFTKDVLQFDPQLQTANSAFA